MGTIKNFNDDRHDRDHVSQRMDSLRFSLAGPNQCLVNARESRVIFNPK